jgi:phage shock protein A
MIILVGQIARKLTELDRHIAQAQELRARLVCAGNELKARMKNGEANYDAAPAAAAPARASKPRPVQRAYR